MILMLMLRRAMLPRVIVLAPPNAWLFCLDSGKPSGTHVSATRLPQAVARRTNSESHVSEWPTPRGFTSVPRGCHTQLRA